MDKSRLRTSRREMPEAIACPINNGINSRIKMFTFTTAIKRRLYKIAPNDFFSFPATRRSKR